MFQKSDAKIEITITTTNLIRIKYPFSSFNYRLFGANVANFNKIHQTVSEQQLFKQEGQHPLTGQRAANFRLLANQWAERRLVIQWRHGCRSMRRSMCNAGACNGVGPFAFRYQGKGATPCQYIDNTRKAVDCVKLCRWDFLCNETLQQTFRPLLSKLTKRRQI